MKMMFLLLVALGVGTAQAEEKKAFTHESSISIVQTGGNSTAETYNVATDNTYKPGTRDYHLYGNYTLSYADDPDVEDSPKEETARNWKAGGDITQDLTKKLGATLGQNYEGNTYAGYKQKDNSDIGLKYQFFKTDKVKLSTEVSYRYTVEKRTERDDDGRDVFYFQKGNITVNYSQKLNDQVSYKFWVQYLPNFTESEDYQVNFEPSITVTMSDILSLRVSYKGQYDNKLNPGVEEYLDHTTTTALVAKF